MTATAGRLGILVGSGVVQQGAVEGLRAFASAAGCGVVNTWGAKGVFRWDDPLHFGTAGLQAHDFELAGLADVHLLITSGLDPAEVTSTPWAGRAEVLDLPPTDLATAAELLADVAGAVSRRRAVDRPGLSRVAELVDRLGDLPPGPLERPRLYTELAAVVGPLYERTGSAPARAAALAAALPPGGLVVAEPGLVGFWVARTFPTSVPGSVCVPATGGPDAAWAVAAAAAAEGRSVTLVAPAPPPVALPGVALDLWDPAEVDLDPTPLVAVAGPIVAWT